MERFRDKPWEERVVRLGDEAEGVFELQHVKWARYGFNRPDIDMSRNSKKINYTPDYVADFYGTNTLVEVQGCGRDQLFKFKEEKVVALKQWQTFSEMPVIFWLWDGFNKRSFIISVSELLLRIVTPRLWGGETGMFPEGKTFVKFHAETFDLETGSGK